MATSAHISRFTPSRMPPATLEAMFVQRQELAEDAVERIREGALKGNRPQLLFIGPRGCGKTHFVSLVYHRLANDVELDDRLRIAWLTEDETAASFLDLQWRVYKALSQQYPAEFSQEALERIYDLGAKGAARRISDRILEGLGDRSALIIVENLDQLFKDMGRPGQQEWRAYLQETGRFALLATAQQLLPDVSSRDAPFFGSFQTLYLEPLSADEGRQLLQHIAKLHGDSELETFLDTPRGRARVRALQHLSGGNHRVYVVLSEFINRQSLDQLIDLFEKTLDELTPYYQERMRWLSTQQRKIVEHLSSRDRPVAVKELARALFSTNQVISSQLKLLRENRYVRSASRGKESLYELTEPLMRMALELKENRGGPLRLVVEFLRIWYDREQLDGRLRQLPGSASVERMHIAEALRWMDAGRPHPVIEALRGELALIGRDGDRKASLQLQEELAATSGSAADWSDLAELWVDESDYERAITAFSSAIAAGGAAPQLSLDLVLRSYCKWCVGDFVGAVADATQAIEWKGAPIDVVAIAYFVRASAQWKLGRSDQTIRDCTCMVELDGISREALGLGLRYRGFFYLRMSLYEEALGNLVASLDVVPEDLPAQFLFAEALLASGQWEQGFEHLEASLKSRGSHAHVEALAFVRVVYADGVNRSLWRWSVGRLVQLFAENYMPAFLALALVRSVADLMSSEPSPAALEEWRQAWHEAGQAHELSSVALNLFDVGLNYVISRDPKALLDLPIEQRAVLEQLFDAQVE